MLFISNTQLRWLGTISYMIGMVLTAINVYPANLWGHLWGGIFWTLAALESKDPPLILIEFIAIITYGAGLIALAWNVNLHFWK